VAKGVARNGLFLFKRARGEGMAGKEVILIFSGKGRRKDVAGDVH